MGRRVYLHKYNWIIASKRRVYLICKAKGMAYRLDKPDKIDKIDNIIERANLAINKLDQLRTVDFIFGRIVLFLGTFWVGLLTGGIIAIIYLYRGE